MNGKMISSTVITAILILILLGYLAFWVIFTIGILIKLIIGVVLICLIGVSIYVLIERIKEIRSGEEDDLSKY